MPRVTRLKTKTSRTWDDDLRDALIARVGSERGAALSERYAPRFPDYYKSNRDWGLISDDVLKLVKIIREKVYEKNEIHLESEVQIWP